MNKMMMVIGLVVLFFPEVAYPRSNAKATGSRGLPDKALMEEINDSWSTMDPDNAARYYDMSPGNVFYDISPFKYIGWPAYAAGAREFFATLRSIKYVVGNDAVIHTVGKMAWGTATLHLETVDKQDRTAGLDVRWTPVWEKKGSRWLIVHEHLSIVCQAEPKLPE